VSTNYPDQEVLAKQQSALSAQLSDRSKGAYYAREQKQRGDPEAKDWYIFAGFTLSYHIKNPICYDF